MTALSPGASPPPVLIAIRRIGVGTARVYMIPADARKGRLRLATPRDTPATFARDARRRFVRVIRNFLSSEVRVVATLLLATLVALLLAISGLNVVNSYVGRDFMTSIEHRDMARFVRMAGLYAGAFVLSTVVAVMYRFVEERLGLLWREWLTRRLLGFYFVDQSYHHLKVDGLVTNPDQRIAEDVRVFTTTTLSLLLMLLI